MTTETPDANAEIWKSPTLTREWVANMGERERKRVEQRLFVAQLLPFDEQDSFTFLDLGAGAGAASSALLSVYPNANAVLCDFSPQMIESGTAALAPFEGRFRYVEFDMLGSAWPAAVPAQVDAATTSMCVHHIPDARKRTLFREILEHLRPGGWYVNFDPVRSLDPAVEAAWKRVGLRLDPTSSQLHEPQTPDERARRENHVRYMIDLERQLGFLGEAGFAAVDVYWKRLGDVIYGGRRPE